MSLFPWSSERFVCLEELCAEKGKSHGAFFFSNIIPSKKQNCDRLSQIIHIIKANIDITSMIDITSKLNKNQARKFLSELLRKSGVSKISLSTHCREELKNDNLTTVDLLNVLKAGFIKMDPEFENENYRYKVETDKIVVVISFVNKESIRCITAWRK